MIAPGTGSESGAAAMAHAPLVGGWAGEAALIVAGYAITLALSGVLVRFFVLPRGVKAKWPPEGPTPSGGWPRFDPSAVIGKCENLITVTLVLTDNLSGLALIFAAKSLVRSEAIKRDPGFYLGGTLVNLVWGLLVASIVRVLLQL
ncbi:MAG: hypothetical protein DYG94_11040 [Leptolyngbya sp. PLA3]|nr:MAG: hypothetical protein EDM82_09950 [Cyanobacteria bacterium CYA]MCE7969263.1 hypothetical protein [Leptolyngbya sp. PL-A3]